MTGSLSNTRLSWSSSTGNSSRTRDISERISLRRLFVDGIQLITKLKNNMKGALMSVSDKLLLRKRAIIETVNDELKNIAQVEHSRHRCFENFVVNMLGALAAYCCFPQKAVHQCSKNIRHTAFVILNSSNSRYLECSVRRAKMLPTQFIELLLVERAIVPHLVDFLLCPFCKEE